MQPRPHFSKEGNTFVSRWSGASGDKKREPEKKEENQKEIWLEKINSRDKKHIKSPKVFCATERFQDCNIKQTNLNFKNKTALNMLTVPTAAMRLSSIPYLFQHLHTEP